MEFQAAMACHLPYGITQYYLPRCHPIQVSTPCLNASHTGRYSIYLPRRDNRPSWPGWLVTYRDGLLVHRRLLIKVLTMINDVDQSQCAHHHTTPLPLQQRSNWKLGI